MPHSSNEFERELHVFRVNSETAAQFFYSFQALHYLTSSDKKTLALLNQAPLFWNTQLGALRESMFVSLGRVFDQDRRSHGVSQLLDAARSSPALFTREALERRKWDGSGERPEWLDDYLQGVYIPAESDWKRLECQVEKWRAVYDRTYKLIRHKVYAHSDKLSPEEIDKLFQSSSYAEMERIFAFLEALHDALWNLYENGRKPVLRQKRYSLRAMFEDGKAGRRGATAGERVAKDLRQFLDRHKRTGSG